MLVDNAPIREAVVARVAQGEPWNQLALRVGWRKGNEPQKGDTSRLQRRLGVRTQWCRGKAELSRRIQLDVAEEIVRALDIDPIEVGL